MREERGALVDDHGALQLRLDHAQLAQSRLANDLAAARDDAEESQQAQSRLASDLAAARGGGKAAAAPARDDSARESAAGRNADFFATEPSAGGISAHAVSASGEEVGGVDDLTLPLGSPSPTAASPPAQPQAHVSSNEELEVLYKDIMSDFAELTRTAAPDERRAARSSLQGGLEAPTGVSAAAAPRSGFRAALDAVAPPRRPTTVAASPRQPQQATLHDNSLFDTANTGDLCAPPFPLHAPEQWCRTFSQRRLRALHAWPHCLLTPRPCVQPRRWTQCERLWAPMVS